MKDWESVLEQARKDWEKLDRELQDRIRSGIARKQVPEDELNDIRMMEIPEPVNPHWVRPFYYKPILQAESLFYKKGDVRLHPDLLIQSSRRWMIGLRRRLQPLVKIALNLEAVLHRQSQFNENQIALDDKLAHHIRLLHQTVNQLVTEITKLRLEHEELKRDLTLLGEQVEWYKQRHRVLESWLESNPDRHDYQKD